MKTTSALSLILSAIALPVLAQTGDALAPKPGSATAVLSGSIPRTADGKPDFSGVWDHPYVPDMARTTKNGPLMSQEGPGNLPFTPAAQAAFDKYDPHTDGDYTGACLPFGYLRSFNAPYLIEIHCCPAKLFRGRISLLESAGCGEFSIFRFELFSDFPACDLVRFGAGGVLGTMGSEHWPDRFRSAHGAPSPLRVPEMRRPLSRRCTP